MNPPKLERNYLPGYRGVIGLGALTAAAVAIHGYHVGVEDQTIYLPAILRHLHPSLFPHDAILFESQARNSIIEDVVAALVRGAHLSLDWSLLILHLLSIFLLLLGAWRVARRCFSSGSAIWGGLSLLTALLLIPIAGTSQYIVDQYMHPRALATALILLPLADFLPDKNSNRRIPTYLFAGLCFVLAFLLHLQMAVFGLGLLIFLCIPWEKWVRVLEPATLALIPFPFLRQFFEAGSPAWLEAARLHRQHYLLRWEWYEWLGIVAPIFIFWWWARIAEAKGKDILTWLCRRLALYAALVLVIGSLLIIPPAFERLTPFQPMRMFTFVYVYMLLLGGGLLGEFFLKKVAWRWIVVLLPLATGMYFAERALFPASLHLELPGRTPVNDWVQAFQWVRNNTPNDAYFVLNPFYVRDAGEDVHGFRAWAWRSCLADWGKDGGVACLVPDVAPRWQKEVHARDNWDRFKSSDFIRLKRDFGVGWAVIEKDGAPGKALPDALDCPYQNASLYVCKIR